MKYLRLAFSFLTIIPVKLDENTDIDGLSMAAGWFPFVGAFIGGVVVFMCWGTSLLLPPFAASVLAILVWEGLSGGLHLDGLADCCDGMFVAASSARRLEIMKDPRLGTFGGAGLVLYLLLKVALLAALPTSLMPLAILSATTLGRWMVLLSVHEKQARKKGLGASFAISFNWRSYLLAALVPACICIFSGVIGAAAALAAHLAGVLVFRSAKQRLGGVTGDVLGLLIELSEVVVLAVFAVQLW